MSCLKMCTRLRFLCICMVITLPAAAAKRHADPRSRYLSGPAQLKEQSQMEYELWLRRVSNAGRTRFAPAKNIVGSSLVLTVDPVAGAADFTSIQEAIDSLPLYNMARVLVKLNRGLYTEKVHIPSTKAFVTIEGEGAEITIIQWNDTAGTIGPDGKPLGTYSSATFGVDSPYFIARNITFKNSAPVPAPGAKGSQGVALRISADTAAFYGCRFLGGQDTLYDQVGRHYFKDCYIEGSVDFVFGNGLSLYEGCVLHGVSSSMFGAMTAQKRESESDDTGFAFLRCSVTGSGAYYLGRAWGSFSRVVFAFSFMDSIVLPPGWDNCGHPSRETTVYYGQYKCTGPGASFAGRVAWARELTDEEAKPFLSLTFIDGGDWISL